METFDAIVVGLGAHGSAAAAALARRGERVLGLERFERGEAFGSSGGWSRMIRLAYFEDPAYVPFAREAWDRWRALEAEVGVDLLRATGGLYAGPADSRPVAGAIRSAEVHRLDREVIDAAEIRRRWPIFRPAPDILGLVDAQAGAMRIDRANAAHLAVAERHGAKLAFGRRVVAWRSSPGGGFEVEDGDGDVAGADHLVLAAGPWIDRLLPDLTLPLRVERECPCWFSPTVEPAAIAADRLPVWVMVDAGTSFYGIPYDPELGLKVSIHHWGTEVDPDSVDRTVGPADVERVRAFMRRRMPAADGPLRNASVCLYTNTPDEAFVIDRHPIAPGIAFASACSGHGFKFAPIVGDILADLVIEGSTTWPIEPFRAGRFAPG
ncbi:MAG: N-methyl-L-tryptophan oxidase [Chloroflexota bacterium]